MHSLPSSRYFLAVPVLLLGLGTSCLKKVTTLPPGPVTVSGEINDASGQPLANNTVRLRRERRFLETKTDAKGAYSFPSLAGASYTLLPHRAQCLFLPPRADLDNLTASIFLNFGAFGKACAGEPTVNMGAFTGPLTISGHIRDAAGLPIMGARIDLDDDTRAIRFTDITGAYDFHVKAHDYKLRVSAACLITPAQVRKDDVRANVVQDFAAGPGCVTATKSNANANGSVITVKQGATVLGNIYVHLEQRASAAAALARLNEIAAEQPGSTSLTIAGNPAIERQAKVTLPGLEAAGGDREPPEPFLAITTAIAVGTTVVRFESQLPGDAPAVTINRFLQVGRNFTPASMGNLHGPAPTPLPTTKNPPGPPPAPLGITAPGVIAPGTFGELEVAASDTANVIVYGTQNGPFLSTDGGQTVNAATFNKAAAPPNAAFASNGDPTVAVGAPNTSAQQNIYYAQLQIAVPTPAPATSKNIDAIGLYASTNNGATFNLTGFPVNCNAAGAGCVVPDQEHLAVDRINRAVTAAGSFDQLYLAWRNFTSINPNNNAQTVAVACSADGGANWNIDLTTITTTGATFPRLSVAPDGSVLVAYAAYSGATYSLNVQKFRSCAAGFQPQDASGNVIQPATVNKSITEVTDMPGLDRVTRGNYSPVFDDSDASSQTVFIVYSNEASAGNDDIHVTESRDGGATWPKDSIVSTNGTGRKYLPWTCSTVGKKFVTWYDRRNATSANPDLTAYFRSSYFDNGSASTVGVGSETNVSGVNDPQCSPGFFSGVQGNVEESQCTNLPAGLIQGGTCQLAACPAGATPPCGTLNACDFRLATPCATAGERCVPAGGGVPKYGDYNGAACALGNLFVAWSSATPPPNPTCVVDGLPSPSAAKCCSGSISGGTCAPTAAACTPNGGACGAGLPNCCSAGINGQCQAGTCLPAIAMYTGSTCIGPGCAGLPVAITYHQTGACNGFAKSGGGAVSVGPNAAYVIFGIERVDNSGGTTTFNYDPANLFVQQIGQDFFDSSLELYSEILGPFAVVPQTFTAGQNIGFSPVAQGALVVTTTTTDGSIEANNTSYLLRYNRQPSDPPINLVKSNASQTSFPVTPDCKTIVLK